MKMASNVAPPAAQEAEPVGVDAATVRAAAGGRVLMLVQNNPYPQDPRVRREARALADAGYQVSVISPALPGQPWRETLDGVRAYRYPLPPAANGFLGYLLEYGYSMVMLFLVSLLVFLREGFDVIHVANPPDTLALVAAGYKLLGKRFVYDHHDLAPEMYYARFPGRGNRLVHFALVLLEKLSCRLADHVIATNESYKKMEIERGRVREACITIVRNGTDLHRMGPVEPDRALRSMKKTIVGFAGVMGFQDGVDYLLRALHHLVRDLGRTDFYCVLIGGGDAFADLKVLTRHLALDEYVRFTGYLFGEDLVRVLSAADICVDPDPSNSYNDRSTMMKLMEYMALCKPIVAFDLPEHRFTAQQAAIYVTPNDERAFAQALAMLMDDPARRHAMGADGRGRVERELAWHYSVPKLLEVYGRLLAGTRRETSRVHCELLQSED